MTDYPYLDRMPKFERDGIPSLTGFRRETVAAKVVLAVRDPLVVGEGAGEDQIVAELEGAEQVARTGLFTTYTGRFRGVPISVVLGGSGSPEAELALMDLFNYTDCDTVIRIGGCGGWGKIVRVGDVVISSGAVRDEGTTIHYMPMEYPAIADRHIVAALADAAKKANLTYAEGIAQSKDSFYGQHDPGSMPAEGRLKIHVVVCMGSTIDDVHHWCWKSLGIYASDVLIKWKT